jgi:hypothetical protein
MNANTSERGLVRHENNGGGWMSDCGIGFLSPPNLDIIGPAFRIRTRSNAP